MNYSSHLQRRLYHAAPYPVRCAVATIYGWNQRRKRYGRHFRRHRAELEKSQWFRDDALDRLQADRVRNFLIYARDHSAYHRRRFADAGFEPEGYVGPEDLPALPLLTKADVRENIASIVSDDIGALQATWSHTSGTTGQGLRFPESLECFQREYAFRVQSYEWAGARLFERWAFCAGHPVADPDARRPPFWVRDLANRWMLMSSYHLTGENLHSYIEALSAFRPRLLSGYPSSLFLLAIANLAEGSPVRPSTIVTSSETLFGNQRAMLEASFGCRVYSYYGNAERAGTMSQCSEGLFHVRSEHSLVEILREDGRPAKPGEEGRLVATAFGNYAAPLIRYQIGDSVLLSERRTCACGRGGLLVDRVLGRMEDYIITPDGRLVGRLDHLFKDALQVRLAQIVQNHEDEVVLRIVREPGYGENDEKNILHEARARLGGDIRVRFEYVESIPRAASGKHRFVISRVKQPEIMGIRPPGASSDSAPNA